MKTLVERIRNRELAIENDGSVEELRKVLRHCFPEDGALATGFYRYYYEDMENITEWYCSDETDFPTVSVKEVLAEIEGEGKETIKYYKLVSDKDKVWSSFEVGKIYPDTFMVERSIESSLKDLLIGNISAHCFEEVSEKDYLNQESKETKVIYLNEEDKPKIEEPVDFIDWLIEIKKVQLESYGHRLHYMTNIEIAEEENKDLIQLFREFIDYENNFKPNDKPIEFTHFYNQDNRKEYDTNFRAIDFDIVLYVGNGFFWCTDKGGEGTVSVFKGNLNNGKVK